MAIVPYIKGAIQNVNLKIFWIETFRKLLEHFSHCFNALSFLLNIWMDIEVEGCADVGVAEENTDGFVVAFALDAASGKTVAEAVEAHFGEAELLLELVEVAAVGAWFRWLCRIGEDVKVSTDNLFQGAHQCQEVASHRNLPDGVLGLGFVND